VVFQRKFPPAVEYAIIEAGGEQMAIICPNCSRQFDVTLFQFGKRIRCECGVLIDPLDWWLGADVDAEREKEEQKLDELKRMADKICFYIVSTDYQAADIIIEGSKARKRCEQLFPGKGHLFDMVYGSRFKRLWSQFRGGVLDLR
jgi:hypothetical protein